MAKSDINPLELIVEELAQDYVDLVFSLTEEFAPVRPWYHPTLNADQQLWRWLSGPRNEIMEWLMGAGVYMGWEGADEVLRNFERIFTDPGAVAALPPHLVSQIPIELVEMVQASGPDDAGKHIRKMERMMEGRASAMQSMDSAPGEQPNFPEPPNQPPPLPVELVPGTEGWPLYGMVPRDSEELSAY